MQVAKQTNSLLINSSHVSLWLVDARMEIDLRLGAIFTRFQTMRLQKKFQELKSECES